MVGRVAHRHQPERTRALMDIRARRPGRDLLPDPGTRPPRRPARCPVGRLKPRSRTRATRSARHTETDTGLRDELTWGDAAQDRLWAAVPKYTRSGTTPPAAGRGTSRSEAETSGIRRNGERTCFTVGFVPAKIGPSRLRDPVGGHCQVNSENDQVGFGGHKRWWLSTGWSHHILCVLKRSRS